MFQILTFFLMTNFFVGIPATTETAPHAPEARGRRKTRNAKDQEFLFYTECIRIIGKTERWTYIIIQKIECLDFFQKNK